MDPFLISFGIQGLGAVASYQSKLEQAQLMREQADESLRRTRMRNQQVLGEAKAAGAASGVEADSSSLTNFLQQMSDEFARQEFWAKKAGDLAADATESGAKWELAGGLGGALFNYGQNNNWFKTA